MAVTKWSIAAPEKSPAARRNHLGRERVLEAHAAPLAGGGDDQQKAIEAPCVVEI